MLAIFALAALATSGWLLFERGKVQAGYDSQAWINLASELRQQILDLERRNAHLVRGNAVLQRSADIDRNAYIEVQKALAEVQRVTLGLREELSFYRGLVTPSDRVGLRRQYPPDILNTIAIIVVYQRSGFTLAEIARLLADAGDGKTLLAGKLTELRQLYDQIGSAISGLEHAIECPAPSPLKCPGFARHLVGVLPVGVPRTAAQSRTC